MRYAAVCLVLAAALVAFADAGLKVSRTNIVDSRGKPFLIRGINYVYSARKGDLFKAIPFIARTGANTVRAVLSDGGKSATNDKHSVQNLITVCAKYNLALILTVRDAAGSSDQRTLEKAAQYWISLASVLKGHEDRVIIEIAGQWFASNMVNLWAQGYSKVIPQLRAAGLSHLLLVDAAGFGQSTTSIAQKGRAVIASDKLRNTAFAIQLYGVGAKSNRAVQQTVDSARSAGAPVVVTEFSAKHRGQPTAFQYILAFTHLRSVGWTAYSLYGNADKAEDLANGPAGPLSTYGKSIAYGAHGFKQTSKPLSK